MSKSAELKRLGRAVVSRRTELGYKRRTDLANVLDFSYRVLQDIELGVREAGASSYAMLEQKLRWRSGSIDAILEGGDPTPIGDLTVSDEAAEALARAHVPLVMEPDPMAWLSITQVLYYIRAVLSLLEDLEPLDRSTDVAETAEWVRAATATMTMQLIGGAEPKAAQLVLAEVQQLIRRIFEKNDITREHMLRGAELSAQMKKQSDEFFSKQAQAKCAAAGPDHPSGLYVARVTPDSTVTEKVIASDDNHREMPPIHVAPRAARETDRDPEGRRRRDKQDADAERPQDVP